MNGIDANKELGTFLRSRRDAADPDRLGVPRYGRRRVAGIRREELAVLAGVSTSYYVRIEQGSVSASPSVLEAIASVLGLDNEERRHMHQLAQCRYAPADAGAMSLSADIELVLRNVSTVPIGVLAHDMTVLGWNQLCHAVFAGHRPFEAPWSEPGSVNWARMLFVDPACRRLFVDWDAVTIDLAGRMRASFARTPDDPALAAVIGELVDTSERFATLWNWHPVRQRSLGTVQLNHPTPGCSNSATPCCGRPTATRNWSSCSRPSRVARPSSASPSCAQEVGDRQAARRSVNIEPGEDAIDRRRLERFETEHGAEVEAVADEADDVGEHRIVDS